jgi:hypothetical protein
MPRRSALFCLRAARHPYAIQTRDGKVPIAYTSDKRSTIHHAVFDKSAIAKPAGSKSGVVKLASL